MKKVKKMLALSLAAAMTVGLLAGCGAAPGGGGTPTEDDLAYQTAGISRDTVMYTLDGVDVTADEYLFWILSSVANQQMSGGLADDAAWSSEIEGQPAADFIKNDALETSKLYTIMTKRAADEGITLTDENKAEMDAQVEQITAMLEMQGATFQDWLDEQCVTEATFRKLNEVFYLNNGVMEKLAAPGGELEATPEKLATFMDENGMYLVKHILLSTQNEAGETLSDEEKAAVKAQADALVVELRGATDLAATFDEKMNALSTDPGLAQYPDGYVAYPGQMVASFETASLALAVGEMSDPVESEHGYHIIYKPDPSANAEVLDTYAGYSMNSVMEGWLESAEITTTDAFKNLDVKAFVNKVNELNEARQAAREAAVAATASPAPDTTGAPESNAPTTSPSAAG